MLNLKMGKGEQRADYIEAFLCHPERTRALRERKAALVCIDVQYLDAAPGYGLFTDPEASGVSKQGRDYYFSRLEDLVMPNMRRLQEQFRDSSLEVIHCRICALTKDGRDRSSGHKRLGLLAAPGSKEAEFLPEVAPVGDEIIINKTASGAFPSTNLHFVLQNMGIETLYMVGVYTNECVETTARDACDLGYFVTVVDDACATVSQELHDASLGVLKFRYANVMTTQEVLHEVRRETNLPRGER
ncbi:cysteine hydrolase family protein [Roseibacillus persicicus]|uniref:N-carbamoylsarcosine amidase n=1 Tax=Roseibacillus persicicus TaxID=454148 RepID=A0A918TIY4_9BACT|nr:isochorismatase family cysteine hydrolase [Roseibacillus persicicus]MDQ8189224.1 cysteine hydrolase [Roseibacillus persicicus]GHC44209.1 N-carbamoylsarcosine amidase [Roseibacillus persicicus]